MASKLQHRAVCCKWNYGGNLIEDQYVFISARYYNLTIRISYGKCYWKKIWPCSCACWRSRQL